MDEEKKILRINRNIFFLGLVSFFNDFSSEMILSIFPAFFQSVLKSGAASLGLVEGVADAFSNFAKIFSGRLSDTIQKRKILAVAGYTLSVATRPFYLFASRVFDVFSLRLADRIGKGLRDAPRDALISLSASKKSLSYSFGFHRAMDQLGGILGPLVAFLILRRFPNNFNAVFITAFLVGILAVFSFIFVKEIKGVVNNFHRLDWQNGLSHNFKFFLLSILFLTVGSLPLAVILLRVPDIGLAFSLIPLFYLIHGISYTGFSLLVGKISDRLKDRKVILLGYAALTLSYLGFALSDSALWLVVSFLLFGTFAAFTDGIGRSYTARLTSREERGLAYGLLNGASGFGALIAGLAGGWLWQNYGAPTALAWASSFVALGVIIFIFTHKHPGTNPEEQVN